MMQNVKQRFCIIYSFIRQILLRAVSFSHCARNWENINKQNTGELYLEKSLLERVYLPSLSTEFHFHEFGSEPRPGG